MRHFRRSLARRTIFGCVSSSDEETVSCVFAASWRSSDSSVLLVSSRSTSPFLTTGSNVSSSSDVENSDVLRPISLGWFAYEFREEETRKQNSMRTRHNTTRTKKFKWNKCQTSWGGGGPFNLNVQNVTPAFKVPKCIHSNSRADQGIDLRVKLTPMK